jgi:hypothetical protein
MSVAQFLVFCVNAGTTRVWNDLYLVRKKINLAKTNNFGVKKNPNGLVLVHRFPRLSTKIAKSL